MTNVECVCVCVCVCERNGFTWRWVELQAETRSGSFQSQRFEYTNINAWVSFLIFKPHHIFSIYSLTLVVKISLHSHTNTLERTHTHTHTQTKKHATANKATATIYCVILEVILSVLSTRVSRLDKTTTKIFFNHLISVSDKLVYNYYSCAFFEWLNPYVLTL